MAENYKDLVFTDHAYHRLKQRQINTWDIWQTIHQADKKTHQADKTKFVKTINGRNIQVVAKYNLAQTKWVVVSVWVRGEDDKPDLLWQIICLPFKLIFFLLAKITKIILSHNKKNRHHG